MTSIGNGRVRARGSVRCDTEETNRVDFLSGELIGIAKDAAPLLVDTAEVTKEGLYSMDVVEYSMMMDVVCDSDSSSDETAPNSRRADMTAVVRSVTQTWTVLQAVRTRAVGTLSH